MERTDLYTWSFRAGVDGRAYELGAGASAQKTEANSPAATSRWRLRGTHSPFTSRLVFSGPPDDIMVIETADATLLVAHKSRSQEREA